MSDLTFIETQFPIARLSAESYKERKANLGQTLTRLGKWWGRKPLVLVRASILGMLMPASEDPKRDREIFLKLMTMDSEGLWRRRKAVVADRALLAEAPAFADEWNDADDETREELRETVWRALSPEVRARLDATRRFPLSRETFDALPYDQKLRHCLRPEHLEGPDELTWREINAHLRTNASNLPELVEQLGRKRFGHRPRVGDSFCGGGSIPFEAARIGCEAFGSDLNPIAALLTWASVNLIGGGGEVQQRVRSVQEQAFAEANAQVTAWGIEQNESGWRADAFLYCVEVSVPGCDYAIPLAPSWVIGERSKVIGRLRNAPGRHRLDIEIVTNPSEADWLQATLGSKTGGTGTVKDSRVIDPIDGSRSWSLEELRGPLGLRLWEESDLVPQPSDLLQERLYCIRWVRPDDTKVYLAPTEADLARERQVLALLKERLPEWRAKGFVPSITIPASGIETDRLFRERGWTHWHHLFTPRQLLVNGLLAASMIVDERVLEAARMLAVGRLADWNSRLSAWMPHKGNEKGNQVFTNQALNPLANFSARSLTKLARSWFLFEKGYSTAAVRAAEVCACDARDVSVTRDVWITDPPYADAINYHELADFFLAWDEHALARTFPEWIPDGRRALAVRGTGEDFKRSMVEVYANLARHMPDNGMQMVQFTHQDPSVWADLGMILWAAGLRVTAAWTVATETPAGGHKKGNYVQGTVLLVLRKRLHPENGFLDEVYPLVEDEVRRQIDSMRELDEGGEPNFGDTDYQLAAYAAALRVLTQYQTLDGQDVGHELFRARPTTEGRGRRPGQREASRFEQVIERGIQIACDYLVPRGLETVWQGLSGDERLYLRALDVESRGERRQGMYQELARGFGVREVKPLLHTDKANSTRVRTPGEFGRRDLEGNAFGGSKLRQLLFAVHTTATEEKPESGMRYLKDELRDYWSDRQRLITLLDWLANLGQVEAMSHWNVDCQAARLLAGRLRSDHG